MSGIADLIRRMKEAGAPLDAILMAVEVIEAEQKKDADRRAKRAAQKRKERTGDSPIDGDTSRDSRATVAPECSDSAATPEVQKESSPTPPKRKTNPSSLRSEGFIEREHADFLDWAWRTVPKRNGDAPKPFKKSLVKAIQRGEPVEVIREGLLAYAAVEAKRTDSYRKGAAVWANAEGWQADYSQPAPQARAGPHKGGGWAQLGLESLERDREQRSEERRIGKTVQQLPGRFEDGFGAGATDGGELSRNPATLLIAGSVRRM